MGFAKLAHGVCKACAWDLQSLHMGSANLVLEGYNENTCKVYGARQKVKTKEQRVFGTKKTLKTRKSCRKYIFFYYICTIKFFRANRQVSSTINHARIRNSKRKLNI